MLRLATLLSTSLFFGLLGPLLGPGDAARGPAREGHPRGGRGEGAPADANAPPKGRTIDFEYDAADLKDRSRAYTGRIFLHDQARTEPGALPLVVFFHGLNREKIPFRWMGGGKEGDVRRIVGGLIESGAIRPVLVAGPSSTDKDATGYGSSFPAFDLDKFVAQVEQSLDGVAHVDRRAILVFGHSGAGCSEKGGIVSATSSKLRPHAVVSIDTCMPGTLAASLGAAHPDTHVLVTWQSASWDRDFSHFERVFRKTAAEHPQSPGVLRELDNLPALPRSHDATVAQTFEKWLPKLLPRR